MSFFLHFSHFVDRVVGGLRPLDARAFCMIVAPCGQQYMVVMRMAYALRREVLPRRVRAVTRPDCSCWVFGFPLGHSSALDGTAST